jgi:hypothetical protein
MQRSRMLYCDSGSRMGREEGRFAQATGYAVASPPARNLRDLRHRRFGQPVYVTSDHPLIRKGQVATWEKFNVRLAVVKFTDNVLLGYDPADLLLPTRFDDQGQPIFEIRVCELCQLPFSLTQQEVDEQQEPTRCSACQDL